MKRLIEYLSKYKLEAFLAPLFKLFEAGLELIIPLIMANIIDIGIENSDTAYILRKGLMLVIIAVLGLVAAITAQYFSAKIAVSIGTVLRNDLFKHIISLSHENTDELGNNTLINRMINDTNQVQTGINMFFRLVLRSPFIVFGSMFMAFVIDMKISMIFISVIIILSFIVFIIMRKTVDMYALVQKKLDSILGKISENLSGARIIRSFAIEDDEIGDYKASNEDLFKEQIRVARLSSIMNPLTYLIINIGIILILHRGAFYINVGKLSQGQVIALINYMSYILVELLKLANLINLMVKAISSIKRIEKVFEIENELFDGELNIRDFNNVEDKQPVIEFENVDFKYKDSKELILENINLKIYKGESVGIIGSTGCGKTTLINLIPRFYDISSGKLLLYSRDIKSYSISSIRSIISLVEQKVRLFKGDIISNILWGKENADIKEIEHISELACASEFIDKKPDKYMSKIEQYGRNISGGQRQRISIARALIKDSDILIMDDALSALDYLTDYRLRQNIAQNLRDKTIIIVSQRISSIRNMDKIVVMEEGKIAGIGKHDELLNSCDVYKEIYMSQTS